MTPTKKQITEVIEAAKEINFPIEKALKTLSLCSASIYKTIGAKGVVNSALRASDKDAVGTDYIVYNDCGQLGNKNNNEFLSYNGREFWISKSAFITIKGITCFHKKHIC